MIATEARPLLLVGAGKMGGAMLDGWLARGLPGKAVVVADPAVDVDARVRWQAEGVSLSPAAPEALAPSIVVLAVKPQIMGKVLPAVRPLKQDDSLVLSVAAGITLATLEAGLGPGRIVRSIPNTPAQIGKGVTVAVANAAVTGTDRAAVASLLSAVGTVHFIEDEALMDAVTAVSGSGPAYVFHLVECLAAAGARAGLPPALAMDLARQTVVGASALMEATGEAPDTLRRNVTSPNGTTQAALDVLMAGDGLSALMERAVAAATRRSRELGA